MVDDSDVEVGHTRATAVVGPDRVSRGVPQLGRCTPNRTVAGLEGQTGRQAGIDDPRRDLTRTGDGRNQRQIRGNGVVGQGEIRIGDGRQFVDHSDVEVGHTRATAVVRPNHVGSLWPQFRKAQRRSNVPLMAHEVTLPPVLVW